MGLLQPNEDTACPDVTYTSLSDGQMNSTLDVSKSDSSFLFAESRKKSIQLRGSLVSPDNFMRTPLPLFSRVDSFRLSAMYVSHNV